MNFICNQDDILASLDELFMLSPDNNCFSSTFWRDTWLIDNVHSVLKRSQTFQLEFNVPFFDATTAKIACNTELLNFLWNAIMFTLCRYTQATWLFLENNIFIHEAPELEQEGKQCKAGHGCGPSWRSHHLLCNMQDLKLLFMAVTKQINKTHFSSSLRAHSFQNFK